MGEGCAKLLSTLERMRFIRDLYAVDLSLQYTEATEEAVSNSAEKSIKDIQEVLRDAAECIELSEHIDKDQLEAALRADV